MRSLVSSNNEIIEQRTPGFLAALDSNMQALGIKRNRTKKEPRPKAKFRKNNGEITAIGIGLTKGLIMTHKGKGAYPQNRKEKPFFNEEAAQFADELASEIAMNTGDIIAGNLVIR